MAKAERELVDANARLRRDYTAIWQLQAFNDELVQLVFDTLSDLPVHRDRLLDGIERLTRDHGGVPPEIT